MGTFPDDRNDGRVGRAASASPHLKSPPSDLDMTPTQIHYEQRM